MKRMLLIGVLVILLAACANQTPVVDNGNLGRIKVIGFFDENQNGVMEREELGAPVLIAIAQEPACASANPDFMMTDASGVLLFKDLRPGRYCVFIDNGYNMTTKINQDVYLSSDQEVVVAFGVVRP